MIAAVAALETDALIEAVAQAGFDDAGDRPGTGQAQGGCGLGQGRAGEKGEGRREGTGDTRTH